MVITLNPLLKVSAGQWNTLVNFASALCGLADQICIGTNRRLRNGNFIWSTSEHHACSLEPEQLQALVLGLPWRRLDTDGAITLV